MKNLLTRFGVLFAFIGLLAIVGGLVAVGVVEAQSRDSSKDIDNLDASGNASPGYIWSDDTTIWLTGHGWSTYAYNLSTGVRDTSKEIGTALRDTGNFRPAGIWSDGTTIYVADIQDAKIYAYNLSAKTVDSSKDFNTLSAAGNDSPRGIWSDGATMHVADSVDRKVYAYNLSTKARDPSKDIDATNTPVNHTINGIWSDGTTMYIVYPLGDSIDAYNLSTGARDPSKDFDNLDDFGNANPVGIWSNGTAMYVVDSTDDLIYAYNFPSAPDSLAHTTTITVGGSGTLGYRSGRVLGTSNSIGSITDGTIENAGRDTVTIEEFSCNSTQCNLAFSGIDSGEVPRFTLTVSKGSASSSPIFFESSYFSAFGDTGLIRVVQFAEILSPGTLDTLFTVGEDTTLTFADAPPISTDASLSALNVVDYSLTPDFSANTLAYSVSVPHSTSMVQIQASTSHVRARISGGGREPLNVGENTRNIVVTAEDGTTTRTYVLTITREAGSADASLSALSVDGRSIVPNFATGTTAYTLSVPNPISQIAVAATATDNNASITGTGIRSLNVGTNNVDVVVTAEDGTTQQTYRIVVTRGPPPSTDATLSGLSITGQAIIPSFTPGTRAYSASVAHDVSSVTVAATATDDGATVSGTGAVSLSVGSNTHNVVVTACLLYTSPSPRDS